MTRRLHWPALIWAISLAAAGALVAFGLAGTSWAAAGAVIGAVTGAFAPSVYDGLRDRDKRRGDWRNAVDVGPQQSWARLLDPRLKLVGFVGREEVLTSLLAWCEDEEAGRLRLVTGPGGVGKTRLAVELADRVTRLGWRAEHIADSEEAVAIPALRAVTGDRALLVVDYAETRIGLKQMLTALGDNRATGVRVLLLARAVGDWWDQLGVSEPTTWDLVQDADRTRVELPLPVDARLSDAEVIALAVASFARNLHLPEKEVEILGGRADRRRILDLHAAALVAVLDRTHSAPIQVDINAVLDELLRHERHFWYNSAQTYGLATGYGGATTRVLRQIVAASCLLGAATEEEARALPRRVPGMSPSVKVAEWLRSLYPPDPGESSWMGSMRPDRLAELHTVRELAASPEFALACLADLNTEQALRAVTLLARASADQPEAVTFLRQTLPEVIDLIIIGHAPAENLSVIFNAIPYPTVSLSEAAIALGQRILSVLPADAEPAIRAYWLRNLGVRYKAAGRTTEALSVEQEAVAIARELTAANPETYRPVLARSLGNFGVTSSTLGRHAEALLITEEAVTLFRELAAASPGRYESDVAWALTNLGIMLSKLGRFGEALTVAEEAVAIGRELADTNPDRYTPSLVAWLNNLGARLFELDRQAEAVPIFEQAVAIGTKLADANPDRYRPGQAGHLANLGETLAAVGRAAEALPITEEAVAIYRELAVTNPRLYRPFLAMSLRNLGEVLYALGRTSEGLLATEEADAVNRELATADADEDQGASCALTIEDAANTLEQPDG